ncbi:hypothetical protein DF3PA_220001 [Candidatus Defluviicoccus seviourii]|uniref:Uncharacterized protein n=1 Tax=Candidatus Defluviicoccus seviourii TaxID=2565273 RepID=A0A564WFV2_9PROT|nr:hypothetical protein DF3PA_220001 [Candidatus Defluviicoccus seviourii]
MHCPALRKGRRYLFLALAENTRVLGSDCRPGHRPGRYFAGDRHHTGDLCGLLVLRVSIQNARIARAAQRPQ